MPDLILVLAAVTIAVAGHELAHLAAARLVGHEVFEIQIGTGPAWSATLGTVEVLSLIHI